MSWRILWNDGYQHIIPFGELHTVSTYCRCHPEIDDDLVIHNSFDGREAYERGERKPS
jgi:hypothetical protein